MKKAMADIWESGVRGVLGALLLTIHDELCFSRPETPQGREALEEVHRVMEACIELKVPILAKL